MQRDGVLKCEHGDLLVLVYMLAYMLVYDIVRTYSIEKPTSALRSCFREALGSALPGRDSLSGSGWVFPTVGVLDPQLDLLTCLLADPLGGASQLIARPYFRWLDGRRRLISQCCCASASVTSMAMPSEITPLLLDCRPIACRPCQPFRVSRPRNRR
jgi:hypothetical protein